MSDESIKPPSTSNKMLNPSVNYVGTKAREKVNVDLFKTRQNFIWPWKNSKHLHCLWNWKKCSRYKQLSNAGKLFVWCS